MTGTAIVQYLLDHYQDVHIRASFFRTQPTIVSDRVTHIKADLRCLDEIRAMASGCDCAIMSAAYAGGAAYTSSSPFEHMRENLIMNRQMLEAFATEGVSRIVFIGSAVIYQAFNGHITEAELDFNKDPHPSYYGYSWAMRFLEKMCQYLHEQYHMEVVMVRAANIFGPRDKFDPVRSNFIPAIIRKAADRMDPFEAWGSPDVTRDVIYCEDFAEAVVRLADAHPIRFDVFNVGSEVRTTVGQVVDWALKYTGHQPSEIRWVQDKPTTIQYRALDCAKIRKAIDWQPAHTIEEGLAKTAQWWMAHREEWTR